LLIGEGNNLREILDILKQIRPECNFTESKDFLNEGLLDSFDIVTLVSKLEEVFSISIDGEDVTPENFKNLAALETFIKLYLKKNES